MSETDAGTSAGTAPDDAQAPPGAVVGAPNSPEAPELGDQDRAPDDGSKGDPNAEAKTWRLKYRAAETQLKISEARVTEQNRHRAEEVAGRRLADPSDMWAFGGELASMLNDDGLTDDEAVTAFADQLIERKPHLAAKLGPVGAPASAVTGDGKGPQSEEGFTFADVLKGKAR